ncbi:MAG: nitrogen fixation protein NifH [Actinomycetota bacterium]
MEAWRTALNADPLPWLLERDTPAVRHQALRLLLDEPEDSAAVRRARAAAMRNPPISAILEAQDPEGFWVKPGSGYSPKYTSTVWSLIFLDQLGADPGDRRVRAGCEYVLEHAQASNGGFGWQQRPSTVVHCLNGNLLRSLLGFGWFDDPRVKDAIAWEGRAITGEGVERWYASTTSGPGFGCGINGTLPCAWGAIKALRGLARIPPRRRTPLVRRAIRVGADLLLSCDPAVADYPTDTKVSSSWFKLGFPSGYVADVLQYLEVLAELGHARDPRLTGAIDSVLAKQDASGRWRNRNAYAGKTWGVIEEQGAPSKWVTLRACTVVRAAMR